MSKHLLDGKTLLDILVSADRQAIKFVLMGGEDVVAKCDADCCSYTWIEHVDVPCLPGRILSVEDVEMPRVQPERGEHGPDPSEEVEFYGLKIATDVGHVVIDYRNDSNGYYGGKLSWPNDYHYGGVHGQNQPDLTRWVKP